ncbi:Prefoldin subunit 4 [Holothuria leucospilota]|uniref:Prefoldin subunit 4 n=1 Tax=Holothuria leucospilota TaxID=206669 RepID=A0A9Q1CCN1_HOLLE|nr:Prefoldin subunit 4 [Holothuria leucospilota]
MASVSVSRGNAGSDEKEDVNITFEDQQKINKFARQTNKIAEIEEEIKSKKKQLQNIQDASDELELADEDDPIPYPLIGEVFVYQTAEGALKLLEEMKTELEGDISQLDEETVSIKEVLGQLKVQLYAKFGNNINLEMDED